jgi:hypothetical protein
MPFMRHAAAVINPAIPPPATSTLGNFFPLSLVVAAPPFGVGVAFDAQRTLARRVGPCVSRPWCAGR